jgi:hypothetical protein
MPVVVVETHTDHAHPRMDRRQEVRVGVGRAVVRDLQHVRGDVHTVGQHGLLRLDLDVTRQQDAHVTDPRPEHQRGIVRVRARVVEGGGWSQHLEVHLTDVERRADGWCPHVEAVLGELIVHQLDPGRGLGERTGDHLAHGAPVQHTGQPTDVVQVVVREDK